MEYPNYNKRENNTFAIQKSHRDDMSVECWNNLLILTCHPYGILLTDTIFSTDISSLRDFLNATTEQSVTINASLGRDWQRRAPLCYGCFAEPVPNEVGGHAMTVSSVDFLSATTEINAGTACKDRANEVEPRPNENRAITSALSKSRRDNTLLTVCFSLRYGIALKKSHRDDISVAEENNTFAIKKSHRDDISVRNILKINAGTACRDRANEVEPRPNEV